MIKKTPSYDKLDIDSGSLPLEEMKKPAPAKSGSGRAIFWAIILLLAVGGCAWWLIQPDDAKRDLRAGAAVKINDMLRETPMAGLGNLLLDSPPPPPDYVLNPPTSPGTLAGRQIAGTIGAPADLSMEAGTQGLTGETANVSPASTTSNGVIMVEGATGETAAQDMENSVQVVEDKSVPPGYLAELANWLVNRYHTANAQLGVTAQSLNHYGGVTLASQAKGGRAGLLRYIFQPSMLQALYRIYIERFMEDLNTAAEKKGFSETQNRQFHLAIAGKTVLWASALEGVLKVSNLKGSLQKIENLGQKTVDINMQLATAVFELDELREKNASRQQMDTIQMRVDGLAARYRRATEDHAAAQRQLAQEIRKNGGQGLDQETLLFMAAWAERRLSEDADGGVALSNCVALLRDLGRRCARIGSNA